MVSKADKTVRVPTTNLGEMLVITAGDKADSANAIAIQLVYPALGLSFVSRVILRLLGKGEIPHTSPVVSIGTGSLAQDCASLGADGSFVVLHCVAHVGEPGTLGGKVGVKVDDLKILVHGKKSVLISSFVDGLRQCRTLTSETTIG